MLPWLADTASASPALLAGVRETTLAKIVRDEMLALILRGELAPGQRINEPDVAARLRVSRVPVREALRELESTGLVAARKHAGVFVRRLEPRQARAVARPRELQRARSRKPVVGPRDRPRVRSLLAMRT